MQSFFREEILLYSHSSGGEIPLYSHSSGGKSYYIAIFPGGGGGETGSITPELLILPQHLTLPLVLVKFVFFDLQFSVQCFVARCCPFSFGHCVVCPFVLFLLVIVLSVLLSFFFWSLCCLSFDLRILITPLVCSDSPVCKCTIEELHVQCILISLAKA